MRKSLLLILLFISFKLQAQTIHGQVLESGTNKPIKNASIYIDGTFRGTGSDSSGNFALNTNVSTNIPIVVSSLGYSTFIITNYSADKPVKVFLEPKAFVLKTVVIGDDGMSLQEKIRVFKKEYLGSSFTAKKCVIENIDDIDFNYDKNTHTLTASCDNPLIIYNKELGYRVKSFLTSFSSSDFRVSYRGNQLFEQDVAKNDKESNAFEKSRKNSYLGSRMHFMRALWNDELDKENFKVTYMNAVFPLKYKDLVVIDNGQKYLRLSRPIKIVYQKTTSYIKPTILPVSFAFINENGYFDPTEISWSGYMGDQRVGDLLPGEYVMSEK